jgi:hypothetical protein
MSPGNGKVVRERVTTMAYFLLLPRIGYLKLRFICLRLYISRLSAYHELRLAGQFPPIKLPAIFGMQIQLYRKVIMEGYKGDIWF